MYVLLLSGARVGLCKFTACRLVLLRVGAPCRERRERRRRGGQLGGQPPPQSPAAPEASCLQMPSLSPSIVPGSRQPEPDRGQQQSVRDGGRGSGRVCRQSLRGHCPFSVEVVRAAAARTPLS